MNQKLISIVMARVNKTAESFNKRPVKALSLAIRLRMIGRCQSNIRLEERKKFSPKGTGKLRTVVRQENTRHALAAKYGAKENQCQIARRRGLGTRFNVHAFSQTICENDDGIETGLSRGEPANDIEGHHIESTKWNV
jgi:hypothetical protein